MPSKKLVGNENLVRFVAKRRRLESIPIDPHIFLLRPDEKNLSAWHSDNSTMKERWEEGDKRLRLSGCVGSADIISKNLYPIQKFKVSAYLTRNGERHVDIKGLPPSTDKGLALQAALELVRIATPVLR